MKIENIVAYLSFVSSSLIVYGIVYNIYLFQKFNIDITTYIDLGESLLLFLPALPRIIFFIPLTVMAIDTLMPHSLKTNPIQSHNIYGSLFDGALVRKKSARVIFWIAAGICLVLFILALVFESNDLLAYAYGTALTYIILHFPLVLRLIYDRISHKIKLPESVPIIFYMALFIFASTLLTATNREARILHGIKNPKVKLILKDKTSIETDQTIRYIGKTKDYVFFYDCSGHTTIAMGMAEVVELRIGRYY